MKKLNIPNIRKHLSTVVNVLLVISSFSLFPLFVYIVQVGTIKDDMLYLAYYFFTMAGLIALCGVIDWILGRLDRRHFDYMYKKPVSS